MGRIQNYSKDTEVTANDKWVGSDFENYGSTKNFTPTSIAKYLNDNNVINIGSDLRYRYQTLDSGEVRNIGTLSFESEIGAFVLFSSITTFLLSKRSLKQNDVSQYLQFLNGGSIIINSADNQNLFGFYKVIGLTEYVTDRDFYVVTLEYIDGNGGIVEDTDYIFSLITDKYSNTSTEQVNSDWNSTSGVSEILNKPIIPSIAGLATESYVNSQDDLKVDKIAGKGLSANDYTTLEKDKLAGIASGAEVNVNADWNATSGDAQILNKPTIPSLSGYVPYIGATSNLDLGAYTLLSGKNLIGPSASANFTRFPNALSVISNIASGVQHNESLYIGLMSEGTSVGNTWGSGLYGTGYTNSTGTGRGTGVTGEGHVSAAADTGVAVGVRGYATDAHTGNYNIGLYGDAENGDSGLTYGGNVSLFLANGNIVTSASAPKTWYLGGNLTFDGQGTSKTVSFTNGASLAFPSLTSGSVLFSNGTTLAQDNANFFWDDTNNRLGLGTSAPNERLHVKGNIQIGQGTGVLEKIWCSGGNLISYDPIPGNLSIGNGRIITNAVSHITNIADPIEVNGDIKLGTGTSAIERLVCAAGGTMISFDPSPAIFGMAAGTILSNLSTQVVSTNFFMGIGTTAPSTELEVDGVITATGGNSTSWNAKQDPITLTTTGTSGPATLVGSTLNIPQYSGGGGGSTPVKLTSQTLTEGSWTLVGSYYTYAFSNVNVTTTCDVSVTPQNASYLAAYNAQVLPFVGVAAGVATFYSQFPPQDDIVVDIVITQIT